MYGNDFSLKLEKFCVDYKMNTNIYIHIHLSTREVNVRALSQLISLEYWMRLLQRVIQKLVESTSIYTFSNPDSAYIYVLSCLTCLALNLSTCCNDVLLGMYDYQRQIFITSFVKYLFPPPQITLFRLLPFL